MAEVHAEHRHAGRAGELGGAQERPVATEGEDDLATRPPHRRSPRRRSTSPTQHSAASEASIRTSRPESRSWSIAWFASVTIVRRAAWATNSTDLTRSASSSADDDRSQVVLAHAVGVAPQPQEEFHVARRPRQRAADDAGRRPPEAGRRPGRRRRPRRRAPAGRARPRRRRAGRGPTSNCGFTIGTRSPSGSGARGQGGQHDRQRDERQVGDGEVGGSADRLGGQACGRSSGRSPAPGCPCAATTRVGRSPRPPRRPSRRRRAAARR